MSKRKITTPKVRGSVEPTRPTNTFLNLNSYSKGFRSFNRRPLPNLQNGNQDQTEYQKNSALFESLVRENQFSDSLEKFFAKIVPNSKVFFWDFDHSNKTLSNDSLGLHFSSDMGLPGVACQAKQMLYIQNPLQSPNFHSQFDGPLISKNSCVLLVPILNKKSIPVGIIEIIKPDSLDEGVIRFVQQFNSRKFDYKSPIKIAINGFGRIGRLVFRAIRELYPTQCQVVAIHDLCPIKTNVHLLKFDSAHGVLRDSVTLGADGKSFIIGEGENSWTVQNLDAKVGPAELPWAELDVDYVLESTGFYKTKAVVDGNGKVSKDGYDGHIIAGAKKVILSVPAADEIECTLVCGVNDEDLKPETTCISNASCTTNCLGPIAKVLNDNFKIISGFMTTVHSYTNDQKVADNMHSDLRRARAAAVNIIPTSTGAAKALPIVVHNLPKNSLDGLALRVPTITGSLVDLTVNVETEVTIAQVNGAFQKAASSGPLKGILKYEEDAIISSDIIHDPHSSIVDSLCTKVIPNPGGGTLVKVLSWYDNEWMYSCRCADIFVRLSLLK